MSSRGRLRVLITAGPTREYVDPVRYISNDSSGTMGFALAEAARRKGMAVTLVHGPVALTPPAGVRAVPVVSAREMFAACMKLWPKHDVLIMAAAVADYEPARRSATKRKKSSQELTLRLRPTPDILATLSAARRDDQVVVGFALEDRAPRRSAAGKLRRKGLDAIVLNRPAVIGAQRAAFDILVRGQPWRSLAVAAKSRQAVEIVRLTEELCRVRP